MHLVGLSTLSLIFYYLKVICRATAGNRTTPCAERLYSIVCDLNEFANIPGYHEAGDCKLWRNPGQLASRML
jgi:hypothetical protein